MAAPNIINVATITAKTAVLAVAATASSIVSNGASSGKVLKINSLSIANVDGTNSADITATILRSSVHYAIANTVPVPPDTTLVVISKDLAIYLEEGDDLSLTASAAGDLVGVCSYEELS